MCSMSQFCEMYISMPICKFGKVTEMLILLSLSDGITGNFDFLIIFSYIFKLLSFAPGDC